MWDVVGEAMREARIITPREVYREITKLDDDVSKWVKERSAHVTEPIAEMQRRAGEIAGMFPQPQRRPAHHRWPPTPGR